MNLVFLKRNRLWLKTFVWIFFAMFFSINGLIGQDIFDEKFEQIDGNYLHPTVTGQEPEHLDLLIGSSVPITR